MTESLSLADVPATVRDIYQVKKMTLPQVVGVTVHYYLVVVIPRAPSPIPVGIYPCGVVTSDHDCVCQIITVPEDARRLGIGRTLVENIGIKTASDVTTEEAAAFWKACGIPIVDARPNDLIINLMGMAALHQIALANPIGDVGATLAALDLEFKIGANDEVPEVPKLCTYCSAPDAGKWCSGCHAARYCNRECQLRHWRETHKDSCANLPESMRGISWRYPPEFKEVDMCDVRKSELINDNTRGITRDSEETWRHAPWPVETTLNSYLHSLALGPAHVIRAECETFTHMVAQAQDGVASLEFRLHSSKSHVPNTTGLRAACLGLFDDEIAKAIRAHAGSVTEHLLGPDNNQRFLGMTHDSGPMRLSLKDWCERLLQRARTLTEDVCVTSSGVRFNPRELSIADYGLGFYEYPGKPLPADQKHQQQRGMFLCHDKRRGTKDIIPRKALPRWLLRFRDIKSISLQDFVKDTLAWADDPNDTLGIDDSAGMFGITHQ